MTRVAVVTALISGLYGLATPAGAQPPGTVPENTAAACRNGLDEDADQHVDCDDQDCELFVFCAGEPRPSPTAQGNAPRHLAFTATIGAGGVWFGARGWGPRFGAAVLLGGTPWFFTLRGRLAALLGSDLYYVDSSEGFYARGAYWLASAEVGAHWLLESSGSAAAPHFAIVAGFGPQIGTGRLGDYWVPYGRAAMGVTWSLGGTRVGGELGGLLGYAFFGGGLGNDAVLGGVDLSGVILL